MTTPWWRGAAIYQIYIRSFFDSDGDGHGDLAGVLARLDYIASLGVDALWLSPVHPSPNRDWGYDVADYEGVHPDYGSLADLGALVEAAHARGIKVLLDEVLSHTSDEHPWFAASRDGGADGPFADWYVWADPAEDGTAPNNWLSVFGGPAWAYQPARRQHYHHKFLRQQPKLNWRNPAAREAALKVLDFWLARGIDGFRLDVAGTFLHDAALTDNPPVPPAMRGRREWAHASEMQRHLFDSNLEENVEMLDLIRRRVEAFEDRFVFGEFSEEEARCGGYLGPGAGLHSGYNFNFLTARKLEPGFVKRHYQMLAGYPDHWTCVSFSNHDVPRTVTRFGRGGADPAVARLMFALLLALPGNPLIYMGEELGLPDGEVTRAQLRDPVGDLYWPIAKGRDPCRTPMPWSAGEALGFTTGTPWLPAQPAHAPLTVEAQDADPGSTLNFARAALAARKACAPLRLGEIAFLDAPEPVLAFERTWQGERVLCAFNMGEAAVAVPFAATGETLIAAGEGELGPYGVLVRRAGR